MLEIFFQIEFWLNYEHKPGDLQKGIQQHGGCRDLITKLLFFRGGQNLGLNYEHKPGALQKGIQQQGGCRNLITKLLFLRGGENLELKY